MTGILKDFNFAIAYLDDIIIFSKTTEEHLDHIKQFSEKLRSAHLSMKLSKCHFFTKEIQYLGHTLSPKGIKPLLSKNASNKELASAKNTQTSMCIPWTHGILQKIHQELCKNSQTFDTINSSVSKI